MPFLNSERPLADNYPVFYKFVYIADGIVIQNPMPIENTVAGLKKYGGYDEIRNCQMFHKDRIKLPIGTFVGCK